MQELQEQAATAGSKYSDFVPVFGARAVRMLAFNVPFWC
jgi:hypothetical protein